MAFRRFVARRGVPRFVFSDNAKGFKAMPDLLMRQFEHVSPEWTWIVHDSPWWGGWWERLVRSVKTALRKSVWCKFVDPHRAFNSVGRDRGLYQFQALDFCWR